MTSRWLAVVAVFSVGCASGATKPNTPVEPVGNATTAPEVATAACVDPMRDAIAKGQLGDENGVPYVLPTDLALDLDGDGTPDKVLELDRDGTNVRYELYLQHGSCAQRAGSLSVPGTLLLGRGIVNGMRVLEVEGLCNDVCCKTTAHEELIFQSGRWVPARTWTVPKIC